MTVSTGERASGTTLARRTLVVSVVAAAVVVALLFTWFARDVLLLVFAALLLSVFLRRLAELVSGHSPLSHGWALAVVVLVLVGALVGTFWLRGSAIAAQVDTLQEELPKAAQQLRDQLAQYKWGRRAVDAVPSAESLLPDSPDAIARVTGVVSGTISTLLNAVVIFFVGLVVAGGPKPYERGVLALVPEHKVARAREVLHQLDDTLWWWLLGRLASMTFIGVITGVGLWLLGVPLAFLLALLAALLSFIPNLGPILSWLPAALIALGQGSQKVLWVTALYFGVQLVESYLLAPIIDRRTVYLPPGLTISAQLLFALVGGVMGVALATPLVAVLVVLVTMLYVQDVLGRRDKHVQTHASGDT